MPKERAKKQVGAVSRAGQLKYIHDQISGLATLAAACRTLGLYNLADRIGAAANNIQAVVRALK